MQESRLDWKSPTVKMLLGIILTAVTFASGTILAPVAGYMGLDAMIARPIIRSAFGVAFIIALGGGSWLHFDWDAIRDSWHFARPLVMINLVLAAFITIPAATTAISGEDLSPAILPRILYYTVLCVFVGINEEAMFRGLMFGGLLAGVGNKKNGPVWAAVVSSFAFGLLHVIFDLDFNYPLGVLQGMLKTIETGMFGFIICVSVLERRNLGGAMSVHGFFDWILMVSSAISGSEITATYVSKDPQVAIAGCVIFTIFTLLYLPRTIKAFKRLSAVPLPQYGPFASEQSAPITSTVRHDEQHYQAQAQEGVDVSIGRLKDHKALNNKYLTFLFVFATYALVVNILNIPALFVKDAVVGRVLSALIDIAVCAAMLFWYQRQFEGEFDGVLSWSTGGLLIALPALLMVITNFIGLDANTTFNNPLLALVLALEPGFCEEVIFRAIPGSNWMRISGERRDILPNILVSAAVFGIVHAMNLLAGANLSSTIFQVCYAFLIGVMFEAVFLRVGTIWPSVIMHVIVDATAFLTMDLVKPVLSSELEFGLEFWLVVVFSLFFAVWGLYLVRPSKQDEIVDLWKKKWHKA